MVRALLLLLASGCGAPADPASMAPLDWVIRASLDLRGVRPSTDELNRVIRHPGQAEQLVVGFLDDERFPGRVADLWAEVYLTRAEAFPVPYEVWGFDPAEVTPSDYTAAIGGEALQVLARVAADDLPWTDLVVADWTMANEVIGRIWPVDYPAGASGWQQVRYTDGRPSAGLLSTNGLWWRFGSTDSNANRGRAAALSRLFVCQDYSNISVGFDASLDLLDAEAVQFAVRNDPNCTSCHTTLDPLASYLYGFFYVEPNSPIDAAIYHPDRELAYRRGSVLEPAFLGESGYTLTDLGYQIAGHPDFADCAVEQAWELLLRRAPNHDDESGRLAVREAFLGGGLTARALLGAMVLRPEYRAAGDEGGGVPLRMVSPDLMASQLEDLTGYRMIDREGRDLMRSNTFGLLGLAGGADGVYASRNADRPNATALLVHERLAEAAAWHVVAHDIDEPGNPLLLGEVDLMATPDVAEKAMIDQIVSLHLRLYGHVIARDGQEVEANLELWRSLFEIERHPGVAWIGLVSALLRDPDLLFY